MHGRPRRRCSQRSTSLSCSETRPTARRSRASAGSAPTHGNGSPRCGRSLSVKSASKIVDSWRSAFSTARSTGRASMASRALTPSSRGSIWKFGSLTFEQIAAELARIHPDPAKRARRGRGVRGPDSALDALAAACGAEITAAGTAIRNKLYARRTFCGGQSAVATLYRTRGRLFRRRPGGFMATSNPTAIPEFLTVEEVAKISRSPVESVRDWISAARSETRGPVGVDSCARTSSRRSSRPAAAAEAPAR